MINQITYVLKPRERTYLNSIAGKTKKELKKALEKNIGLRKKQLEQFNKIFIEPQKRIISIGEQVLASKMPIECYKRENENFNKFLREFFGKASEQS